MKNNKMTLEKLARMMADEFDEFGNKIDELSNKVATKEETNTRFAELENKILYFILAS